MRKIIENLSLRYILKDKFSINNLPIKNANVKTLIKFYRKLNLIKTSKNNCIENQTQIQLFSCFFSI